MSLTFDLFRIQTVPPDYSWDEGTPLVNYPEENLISHLSQLSSTLLNTDFPDEEETPSEFIGYAPFVYVALSSEIIDETTPLSSVATERIVNFGDYYNSETNVVNALGFDPVLFCHNYIMPGKYVVEISEMNYIAIKRVLPNFPDFDGLYIQPTEPPPRLPLSWQWNNFYSFSFLNPTNTPIRWEQTGFQQEEQLTWNDVSGPCFDFGFTDTLWNWSNLACDLSGKPLGKDIKWNQTNLGDEIFKTWKNTKFPDCYDLVPTLSAVETSNVSYALLEVREILPTAYLSAVELTPNKESPLTVRLTPRFTKCGSFPIEKIVWDLGDGSPLLVQRRWSPESQTPFVFTNTLTADWQDPRNYDVVHTYRKVPGSGFSFYPSITAYASSTGTTNCASTVVGPLTLKSPSTLDFKILQNELTNYGRAIIADANGSIVVWNAPLTPNYNDTLYLPLQYKWEDSLTWNDRACWSET